VKGDEAFNRWSRRIGEMQTKKAGRPIVEVRISRPGRVRSRIQTLEISQAALLAHERLAGPCGTCFFLSQALVQPLGTVQRDKRGNVPD